MVGRRGRVRYHITNPIYPSHNPRHYGGNKGKGAAYAA